MRAKCEKIERLLSDYIDGTLSERQTVDVALHLRSCRSCKQEIVDLKKTNHLLENFYVEPEASEAYYARFTTQLQHRIEQSAPTALHQRFHAAVTRLGWHLLTQVHRRIDRSRLSGFLSIRRHAFSYYVLALTMTMLVAAPLLLHQISPHDNGEHLLGRLYTAAKTRIFSANSPASVHPTATLAIKQDNTVAQSMGIRRNVSSERTTESPAVDSGADVWQFTDEPMTDGYIFTKLQKNDSKAASSVALDIDSELLAYAELPAQEAVTSRDVLTESRYALLLLQGIDAGQHGLQQYERKWSEFKGFSQKLLDVSPEILSIPEVYDSREL